MEKHEGLPVAGYRPQTSDAVDIVNGNKLIEERLLRRLDEMKGDGNIEQRWLAIARTGFEEAFMALNRAVFKPERVSLPEDTVPGGDMPLVDKVQRED